MSTAHCDRLDVVQQNLQVSEQATGGWLLPSQEATSKPRIKQVSSAHARCRNASSGKGGFQELRFERWLQKHNPKETLTFVEQFWISRYRSQNSYVTNFLRTTHVHTWQFIQLCTSNKLNEFCANVSIMDLIL